MQKLNKAATMLDCGDTTQLCVPGEVQGEILWVSDRPEIAEVDQTGLVTAKSNGDAIIYARVAGSWAHCMVSVGYEGQNPFLPPTWGLFLADGEPYEFDGITYVYCSKDCPEGRTPEGGLDWCSDSYHVIYSADLIHWTDAGESICLADIPASDREGATCLWAPDLFRDPKSGRFYLTFCTNNAKIFLAESDSPTGPFVNPRPITVDGKPIDQIDPSVLVDDDGKVYIACPKFWVGQLDPADYARVLPETVTDVTPWMPTDNEPFEGPSLRKRGDTYYYIYIQNHGKIAPGNHIPTYMGYMTAKHPLGPYTYRGVIVENYDYLGAGNIHGSIAEIKGQWYAFYHMPVANFALTRSMFIDKLTFNEDGTVQQVVKTSSGAKGAFRPGEKIQASSAVGYSGGREAMRIRARYVTLDNPYVKRFIDYPYIYFDRAGQWATYRYVDASGCNRVTLCLRSEGAGGLELLLDGVHIGDVTVSGTGGTWQTVTVPIAATGKGELTIQAHAAQAPIDIDWFRFS